MALGPGPLGLPRGDGASLDVLGKEGTLSPCKGPVCTQQPLSSLPRLPWLRQRLLPQLYGLLPDLGERLLALAVPWGAKHPSCRGVRLGCLLWGQQRQRGQRVLGAAETLWQGCQAAGLFSAEGTERCGKGEGEGAGGASAHVAPPRAAAWLCPAAHPHRDRLGEQHVHRAAPAKGVPRRGPSRVTLLLGIWATCAGSWGHQELTGPMSPPPQVIYKKFQIPCPLPEQEGNITGILNVTTVSTSDYQNGYTVLQAPEQDTCTPSFFTLNSQVRTWDAALRLWVSLHPVLPMKMGGPGAGSACLWAPSSQSCSSHTDSLHHPHHGLRLRLPPRGPAHLHRAEGVSPGWGHPRGGVGFIRCPPKGTAIHVWDLRWGSVGRWVI